MFSFFSGKNRSLGIDIGTTGIKIVELKKENNVPVLLNYALSYDSGSLLQSNSLEMLDGQTGRILQGVLKKAEFGTKRGVVGIPSFLALISFLELPEMPSSEIEKAIRFEAAKYIPSPIDEVNLGWEVIGSYQEKPVEGGQPIRSGQKMQIMVVTVPNSAVERLSSAMAISRISVTAMEVENFATVRCLIGNDKGTFMIVNIGAKATDFTIVSDGIVRVTRSIDVGGAEISRALASGLGIDLQRADRIKKSSQMNLLDSKDQLSSLVGPVIGMILDEVKRLREIYHKKNPLKKIEKMIFTGGTSKLATLTDYFSKQLSSECQRGNSLARIGVKKEYQGIVQEVAPELTVAIGLALRGLEISSK
ncbi:MAG: type IV pilus assembly protein PilM [Candidatus Moranbacteria bacterium]|nr:type IV pilus assembly protein PilM [Candidatus Moranbacteria bacterium]